jgi:hypothetical protein
MGIYRETKDQQVRRVRYNLGDFVFGFNIRVKYLLQHILKKCQEEHGKATLL